MSKRKSHTTGNVRLRKNSYGNPKVISITSRFKSKKHTVMASSSPTSSRKGLKNQSKGYSKKRYVGKKTGRKA